MWGSNVGKHRLQRLAIRNWILVEYNCRLMGVLIFGIT